MTDIDIREIRFTDFTAADVKRLKPYYYMRPNKSCDNSALDTFLWREYYKIQHFVIEGEAVLMRDEEVGEPAGCFPLCRAEDLPYYFKLQERYFNEILGKPYNIFFADYEGVKLLKEKGALEGYEITESVDLRDYLYDAEKLRTLSGSRLAKKRNHVHHFEQAYGPQGGRWDYRKLTMDDRDEILAFLSMWRDQMDETGEGEGKAADESDYDATESLDAEVEGVHEILRHPEVFAEIEAGGIFIDGQLKAFSLGSYNTYEKMAVIDIEKADREIDGLYQVINQQFLIHAFPQAELVNREDDVGLPGLRNSKMSYYPIDFARKFVLKQKN